MTTTLTSLTDHRFRSHTRAAVEAALAAGTEAWYLDTAGRDEDDVLIGAREECEADALAHHGLDELPEGWRLERVEADDLTACECGEATGVICSWTGPLSETVLVEWMPRHLRASHEAAGNRGTYPHNGALRLRCERDCAQDLVDEDEEWAAVVE